MTPYVVATVIVWSVTVARVAGAVRGMSVAALSTAGCLLATSVYLFAIEPIPFAECGPLIQELNDRACRREASIAAVAATLLGALVFGTAGVVLLTRRPRGAAHRSPA